MVTYAYKNRFVIMTSLWRLCSFLLFFNLFFNLLPLLVLPLTFRIRSHIDRCAFPISIRIAIRRSRGVIYLFGLSFVHRFAHALVFCARTKKKRSHKSKMGVCLKDLHFIHWISAMSLSVLTIRVHVPPPPSHSFFFCVFFHRHRFIQHHIHIRIQFCLPSISHQL